LADYSYAIEQRDGLRFTIENVLRSISVRAKSVFGTNSAKYRSLNPGNISQMTESLFLVESRNIHNAAVENLAALTPEGITALYLTTLNTNIDNYETSISTVANKKIVRDDAAETKVLKGNELYALVVKYCDYGKTIWNNVSPAKYNDYLIYTSVSPGSLTAPQNLRYETDYMKVVWDAVENATSYQLEISTDGVNFTELTTTNDPEFSYIPYDAHTYYKVRPRNSSGYGPYSTVMDFWYYDPLPAPANFLAEIIPGHECRLSWELVHSATTYRVYISDVAFGEPEGPFIPFLNTGQLEYTTTLTPGRRMYFKVTCFNTFQPESAFSNTSYVEVTGGTP
jgi:hypothetical protein